VDNEQAKFLLSGARANGADANDPQIAAALAQAQRDPELVRWLAEERAFDAAVMRKLHPKEPPANLRSRLVVGALASRRPPTAVRRRGWWISLAAAAAVVALVAASALWWRTKPEGTTPEIAARPPLLEWQESCLAIFADPNFALDLMDPNYPPLEKYLLDHGTRLLPAVPFAPDAVGLLGCKALMWRDQPVSFLCFKATTGELVHLFVVRRGTADESLVTTGPHREQIGEFATITWSQGDLLALVASKMPATQLEGILARNSTAAYVTRSNVQFAAR